MITEQLSEKVISPALDKYNSMQKITGHPFNKFFKEIKWVMKKGGFNKTNQEENNFLTKYFNDINKQEVIIFSPDKKRLDLMDEVKKKTIFPFDKIFLEYPMKHAIKRECFNDIIFKFTNGFFIDSIKNEDGEINTLHISSIWLDYGSNKNNEFEEGVTPRTIIISYSHINKEFSFDETISEEEKAIVECVIRNLKKICYLVQTKQYNEYYKWTPRGIIRKNVVYSHDVKSHRRHFWKDSGRFKIAFMSKEELIEKGYGIDECVFRGYELRRDVPYKIINSFKVGGDNCTDKKDNRMINILKNRIFKNEERLGFIISKIFVSEHIKKHDRRRIKPFELDFYIHNLKLAFEYDGEQHYDKKVCEEVFKSDFEAQRRRDIKKNALCRRKKIKLIRVKYDEPLTITNIKKIIKSKGFLIT